MTTLTTAPVSRKRSAAFPEPDRDVEQRFVIGAVSWASYQDIARALTGRHVRLTFDRGSLEFMTISGKHGKLSRLIGQLIAALADELGIPRGQYGDMTCDNESAMRGLEPDECFYLTNEPLVRGKDDIDLTVDPPPDLAVEVDLSPSQRDRLSVYAALGIPEVWRYDGSILAVHQLDKSGSYVEATSSRYFPAIPIAGIAAFIDRRLQLDEASLLRSFREWVASSTK